MAPMAGSVERGSWLDYDRDHCFDLVQLTAFLRATQPDASDSLGLSGDGPVRRRFLVRLQGEISKRAPMTCCATVSATVHTT